jgi:uncharacterized protein YdeI (YjbR/CyaY-like superfamily)
MTAALSLLQFVETTHPSPVIIPRELAELLEESPRVFTKFEGLEPAQRKSYCAYVADAALPATRERRAALVAMSLAALPDRCEGAKRPSECDQRS